MKGIGWPAAVVALAFIALVGLMFWRATENLQNFSVIWAAAGPILGIVVGAIPATIFGTSAHKAQKEAEQHARVYAAHVPPASAASVERIISSQAKE